MPEAAEVAVRLAHIDELERTVRLRWLWANEVGDDPGDEATFVSAAGEWARAHVASHLAHIATGPRDDIIGMAWLALTPRVATTRSLDRWSGDLQSCYVLPEWRGRGIGGRLVQAVLDSADARGLEHVTVHTSRDSVRMYERNGFRPNPRLLWAEVALRER